MSQVNGQVRRQIGNAFCVGSEDHPLQICCLAMHKFQQIHAIFVTCEEAPHTEHPLIPSLVFTVLVLDLKNTQTLPAGKSFLAYDFPVSPLFKIILPCKSFSDLKHRLANHNHSKVFKIRTGCQQAGDSRKLPLQQPCIQHKTG